MSIADELDAAARSTPLHRLDELTRTIWKAHAADLITDEKADAICAAIEARRAARLAGKCRNIPTPSFARDGALPTLGTHTHKPTPPDRLARRRRQAASGAIPPEIAAHFTTGEAAALAVIGRQAAKAGSCRMFLDKIAALAGVCRSTVRNAIRKAAAAGLVRVQERRATWWRNLSNVIRVLDAGWRKWLARGRAQNPDRHDYEDIPEGCRSLNVHGGVIPFRETESAAWSARPRC